MTTTHSFLSVVYKTNVIYFGPIKMIDEIMLNVDLSLTAIATAM
jgi:hypothetical protein